MLPRHGDFKGRHVNTYEVEPTRFPARNGEGLCERFVGSVPVEWRYCDRCKDWIFIEGITSFFQADFVGCLRCGKTWPKTKPRGA